MWLSKTVLVVSTKCVIICAHAISSILKVDADWVAEPANRRPVSIVLFYQENIMGESKIKVIKNYFGIREGDTARDFLKELKHLDENTRLELAQGAAANLGLKQEECDFPLK